MTMKRLTKNVQKILSEKLYDNLLYLSGLTFRDSLDVNKMSVWSVYYSHSAKGIVLYFIDVNKPNLDFLGHAYIHEFPLKHRLIYL